jgi:hypothetical protein
VTKFVDGPAAGTTLCLHRLPIFLRAVQDRQTQKWDALDMVDDQAKPTETIVAYRLRSNDGTVHIDRRDAKTGRRVGEWFRSATYAVYHQQPDDATLRDNAKWAEWCQQTYSTEKQEEGK